MHRLVAALVGAVALAAASGAAPFGAQAQPGPPRLLDLNVTNGGAPFAGDRPLLTTISPNRDGLRDRAIIHFRLRTSANVRLSICTTLLRPRAVYVHLYRLGPGPHSLVWAPGPKREPRTYLARLDVRNRFGRRVYGRPFAHRGRDAPVIRVLGIDAAFAAWSYRSDHDALLRIATDAPDLTIQFFRSGPEFVDTKKSNVMHGETVTRPIDIAWRWTSRPHALPIRLPTAPTGLYFAKLTAPDGRVGYAPFVIRPDDPGTFSRVAVVMPTNTWEAYNFYDSNGNGWGDTWYAGPLAAPAVLRIGTHRPFLDRGVPPHFHEYDLGFLHWVSWSGRRVEFLTDSDIARFGTGMRLRKAYDVVWFPGHEEYVTSREYRVVRGFRNHGGSLAFLSADNFYWRVVASDGTLRRTRRWRDLGHPEAGLIGIQYRGNDRGEHQRPYLVERAGFAPWLFQNTGLANGSRFGHFGIEVDGRARSSPRSIVVLAEIKHIFGGRVTAQMSYYHTRRGAKVFAFGAFTLAGAATEPLERTLLDNIWTQLVPSDATAAPPG